MSDKSRTGEPLAFHDISSAMEFIATLPEGIRHRVEMVAVTEGRATSGDKAMSPQPRVGSKAPKNEDGSGGALAVKAPHPADPETGKEGEGCKAESQQHDKERPEGDNAETDVARTPLMIRHD